jgi:hypothetical protein
MLYLSCYLFVNVYIFFVGRSTTCSQKSSKSRGTRNKNTRNRETTERGNLLVFVRNDMDVHGHERLSNITFN